MKKIFLSLAAMASLVLAGCTGDYTDWESPQAFTQEDAAAKYGVTFVAGPEAHVVLPTDEADLRIVEVVSENKNVAGCTVKSLTVNGEAIAAETSGNYITVKALDLCNLIVRQNNSRAALERPYQVKAIVSLNLSDGDALAISTEAAVDGSLTPKPVPALDPQGYYLLGGFQENADEYGNGWQADRPVWMTDNGDGTYTAVVNTLSEGDNWYKFYAGSHFEAGNWDAINQGEMGCAVADDNALQNFVVYAGDDQAVQTPVISGDGQWKIVLDMNNLVYTVTRQAVNYYIVGGPNADWAASAASRTVKFAQPDESVPTYTVTFDGPEAEGEEMWFAIGDDKACDAIVNDNDWSKLYGTTAGNGNNGANGTLARRTDLADDGSFKVAGPAKQVRVTIDMRAMTYTVESLSFNEFIYAIGMVNGTGWDQTFPLWGPDFDGKYQGFYYLAGEYKFKPQEGNADWSGDFGQKPDTDAPVLVVEGEQNCPAQEGFFVVNVDMAAMTYEVVPIEFIDIVGGVVGGEDWSNGPHMTYNQAKQCWEADVTLTGAFKFRGNGNWDNADGNFGGTVGHIQNGSNDNVEPPVTGDVHVELYLSNNAQSYCTITAR